jgi:methylated-DNA-[protein]-cysteine S-methyltransferase
VSAAGTCASGRCGIAWSERGVLGLQLPERSETATRTRLMRHCPTAEDATPPKHIQRAHIILFSADRLPVP